MAEKTPKNPKGAGRPAGVKNRSTLVRGKLISDIAKEYTDEAIEALIHVAQFGSDAARVSAARELLDRAYGRTIQGVLLGGMKGKPLQVVGGQMTPEQASQAYMATLHGNEDEDLDDEEGFPD
jgi:hypothetical protein